MNGELKMQLAHSARAWPGWGLILGVCLLTGCGTTPKSPPVAQAPPKPYLRIERSENGAIALQATVRQLTPPKRRAPVIWLVSAAHIGETNYYAELQKHLDACELVLFEGIGGRPQKRPPKSESDPKSMSSLQTSLAESLGLVFQLEAVDYDRSHFKNSDVPVKQIQEMMTAAAQRTNTASDAGKGMQDLMQIMDGSSFFGLLLHTGVKLISTSPRLQATFKVVFIETLGQLRGDLAQAKGLPPELKELMTFIIKERNQIVMKDLRQALETRKPPKSIAIFYGAGHMYDLEQRIGEEFNYRPTADRWLTAFAVDTKAAGLSEMELNMVRSIVKWQMDQLQK
jgi:hypothetical protein